MLWWLRRDPLAVVSYPISSLELWYLQSTAPPRRDDTSLSTSSAQCCRSMCVIKMCVLPGSVVQIIHPCQLGINVKVQVAGRGIVPPVFRTQDGVTEEHIVLSSGFHI